ncbi:MAG: hypothetical protein M1813_000592 [Trichoglossum hirsutum]|nr:MAG: hypothetical protein M1813_000592 [Trichoglossum hirsutum]
MVVCGSCSDVSYDHAVFPKHSQRRIPHPAGHARAIRVREIPQLPRGGDERAEETEVDERDEVRAVMGVVTREERVDCPDGSKDTRDEEDEDEVRGEGLAKYVTVDEVGEHAKGWDQGDDLHQAPEDEEDSYEHGGNLDEKAVC